MSHPPASPLPPPLTMSPALPSPQSAPPLDRRSSGKPAPRSRRSGWLASWYFWGTLMVGACGGAGYLAIASLLNLPSIANCTTLFMPLASATNRLACAQAAADQNTIVGYVNAMSWVRDLPPDHPMRQHIDRYIARWSESILQLAEAAYQDGQLSEAIAMVRHIPRQAPVYKQAAEQVKQWRQTWEEAEDIYRLAMQEIRQKNWPDAFTIALKLVSLDNRYWSTVKYRELSDQIEISREGGNRLVRAQRLVKQGGLNNLIAAINLLDSVEKGSALYKEAQAAISDIGDKLLDLCQARLDRRDLSGAMEILRKIPASANMQAEIQDFTALAQWQSETWKGGVAELQNAIAQAQRFRADRPLYNRVQQLIGRWQLEIEAVAQLDRARALAQGGKIVDLNLAIVEAQFIAQSNPRWEEAQDLIQSWRTQVETQEDRPVLDLADQVAAPGDVASLQSAIGQLRTIAKGRALHSEAQSRIARWTTQIQRMEDQPILDRARAFADRGDWNNAIATAELVQPGRATHNEAQSLIRNWRSQLAPPPIAAPVAAPAGGTDGGRSPATASGNNAAPPLTNAELHEWSRLMLRTAKSQALTDLSSAIALAEQIPPRTEAYAEAQLLISEWQRQLRGTPLQN